jgi:hypothetical protein
LKPGKYFNVLKPLAEPFQARVLPLFLLQILHYLAYQFAALLTPGQLGQQQLVGGGQGADIAAQKFVFLP